MLSKKLKFDDDVLEIIKTMEWQDEGKLGILTCGQLDRQLYLKVNEALGAMGGKWNRKMGGHVFPMDPRPQVDGLLKNGVVIVERDGFYQTPKEIVWHMIDLAEPKGKILEPSAGLGAIADNLGVPKDQVFCIEKNEQRAQSLQEKGYAVHCGDFLEYSGAFDRIYMNPPFENSQDIDHVQHAYECLCPHGIMVSVMSEGSFFRGDKKTVAFRRWLGDVNGIGHMLPPKSFHESGTDIATRLVVIERTVQFGQMGLPDL